MRPATRDCTQGVAPGERPTLCRPPARLARALSGSPTSYTASAILAGPSSATSAMASDSGSGFGMRPMAIGPSVLAGALRVVIDAGLVGRASGSSMADSTSPLTFRRSSSLSRPQACRADDGDAQPKPVGRSNAVFRDGRVVTYDKSRPDLWRGKMEWIDYGFASSRATAVTDPVASGEISDLADLCVT